MIRRILTVTATVVLATIALGATPATSAPPSLKDYLASTGTGFDKKGADYDIFRFLLGKADTIRATLNPASEPWTDGTTVMTAYVPTDRAFGTMANAYGFTTSDKERPIARSLFSTLNTVDGNGNNDLVQFVALHIASRPAYTPGIDKVACLAPDQPATVTYAQLRAADNAEYCTEYSKQGASPYLRIQVGSKATKAQLHHEWYATQVGSTKIIEPDLNFVTDSVQVGHGVNTALVPIWSCGVTLSPWYNRCP